MSKTVKEFVLETLTHSHINRINFQYGQTRVYPTGYRDEIARAVRSDRIVFVADRRASFDMKTVPGQPHALALPDDLVSVDPHGTLCVAYETAELRGAIVHEATHALQDYQRITLTPFMAEGSAYLAGWMTRLLWGEPRLSAVRCLEIESAARAGSASDSQAHAYARCLAAKLIDRRIVYAVPDDDVQNLNRLVTTASADQYVFNGI